jgi:hypothetical protein
MEPEENAAISQFYRRSVVPGTNDYRSLTVPGTNRASGRETFLKLVRLIDVSVNN